MLILSCSCNPRNVQFFCAFQVDKQIRELDTEIKRFEGKIQDKAISATRKIEEGSLKRIVMCS